MNVIASGLKLSTEPSEARYIISEFIKNLEYLDCIRLHVFRVGGSRMRAIEILKMRGVKHDNTRDRYGT